MADPIPTPAPPNPAPAPAPAPAPKPAPAPAPALEELRQKIDRIFAAAGELVGGNPDQVAVLEVVRLMIDALFTGQVGNPPTLPTSRSPRGRASR